MAITDKLKKGESLFSTTLVTGISTGTGETITLNSVAGLPTDTEITLTFNRVDADGEATPTKMERITGTIVGSELTSYTRETDSSTEQAHAAASVVEYIFNAQDWNDLIDGFLVGHTQAGLHDLNGGEMILDADADTSITADTDDEIDIKIAGADDFKILANILRALSGSKIETDTIDETTAATGVTIDSVLCKDGEVVLVDNGNIQDTAGTDPWKTISLDARAWQPTTTSGCATVATVEAGTNDIDYDVLDFATGSDENAFCNIWMPGNWDAGVIQFRYIWTNAGGGAAETVTFELSGRSYADDDAIDQAVGTAVEVADTWIAQGDIHISAWSGDVTITGATAGELVHLELMRDISEDDLTGDARLIGVQIRYKESQYNHY